MKRTTEQQLDSLLRDGLVQAPDDFSDQLVHRISQENKSYKATQTDKPVEPPTVTTSLWQWLALGTASFAGTAQMIGFIFGIWTATQAG